MNRSTEHEKIAHITLVRTGYSEIAANMKGYIRQRSWSEEELNILIGRVNKLKWIMVEPFVEHYDLFVYTLKNRILNHKVK